MDNKEIKSRINDFNKENNNQFNMSLSFHLHRSMVKHCSPINFINWNLGVRNKGILNYNDNEKLTIETMSIVNDFIKAESQKANKKFSNDNRIIFPDDQFDKYQSLLFFKENHKYVIYYYMNCISLFPVNLQEFEKVFFYFLTFLIEEEYPTNVQINESIDFIKDINDLVNMRYIDIKDRLLLALIHLISIDNELLRCCNAIYTDIKHNHDLTRRQFENLAS